MKSNEQSSPVDEFFRQHEADIPVVYDPDHWQRLAAALDGANTAPTPPDAHNPPVKRPPRPRGGKGWWVSGLWLLTLSTAAWLAWQKAISRIPPPEQIQPGTVIVPPPAVSGMPATTIRPPGHTASGDAGAMTQAPAKPSLPDPAPEQPGVPAPAIGLQPAQPVDTATPRSEALPPADSIVQQQKPPQKKKHLFW